MKKSILFFFVITSLKLSAQDSSVVLSRFEKFTSETGRMYKYENYELGKVNDIKFRISKATDLSTGESAKALIILQNKMTLLTPIHSGVLAIDFDEIDGVTMALEYYMKEINKGKPIYSPQFTFLTSNRVEAACSYLDYGYYSGWNVSLAKRYKYLNDEISGSQILLRNKDIDDVATMFQKSKSIEF